MATKHQGDPDHDDGRALVDAHLEGLPEPQRSTLRALRATLAKVLPHGRECMKYSMPAIAVHGGQVVAGFDGFANHCSYFPHSGSAIGQLTELPPGTVASKGTLQFPVDSSLPVGVVRSLVKIRLAEISDVSKGRRHEYFADGMVKAEGLMRDGEMHGDWRWYRKDGSLLRTGSFDRGRKTGTWRTFDRNGGLVKETPA